MWGGEVEVEEEKEQKEQQQKKADWLVCEVKTTRINDSTPAVGRCSFCFALSWRGVWCLKVKKDVCRLAVERAKD